MNRYYSSWTGRFTTADPYMASGAAAEPQSWNRYSYVGNDPINYTDPAGLFRRKPEPFGSHRVPGTAADTEASGWGWGASWILDGFPEPSDDGDRTPSLGDLISASAQRISKYLAKPDCAKDFSDVKAALGKLSGVGTKDLGTPTFHTENGKIVPDGSGPFGIYNRVTKSVNLNSSINWSDPNKTTGLLDGKPYLYPALSAEGQVVGDPSITVQQFMDITILHELSHYKGTMDPDRTGVEEVLWHDCVK